MQVKSIAECSEHSTIFSACIKRQLVLENQCLDFFRVAILHPSGFTFTSKTHVYDQEISQLGTTYKTT